MTDIAQPGQPISADLAANQDASPYFLTGLLMKTSGFQSFKATGYTEHNCGFSGFFSWFTNSSFPGKWLVVCHEKSFAKEGVSVAITDNFGSLVRVPA